MNNRLPAWFKQKIPDAKILAKLRLISELDVNTVCQQAKCPNLNYCFKNLKFTFMILGNTCTRDCQFCGVNKSKTAALDIDDDEPYRISQIVKLMGLKYVVITSVTRDDLAGGGAEQFAKTIEFIHNISKDIKVEVLIPDFQGKIYSLQYVLDAGPLVVAHNVETIRRLYGDLRSLADYRVSLEILRKIKELNSSVITKSSIMLGLGETRQEIISTMEDLRNSQCDILCLGQYLAPSINHYPVKEFINIEEFLKYEEIGLALGFRKVLSGPLVRSSYQAEEVYNYIATSMINDKILPPNYSDLQGGIPLYNKLLGGKISN